MAKSNFIVRGGFDGSGLFNGLNNAQKRMSAFQTGISKTMKGIGLALGGLAVGKLIRDSLGAASELEGAFVGLDSILTGQGKSFNKAKSFIDDYIKDGLVPLGNAVTAYKNLAQRGYDDTQIQQVMSRLKDAAAFGRQSHLSLGEAVSTATEGLRNEVSTLVDNAGVTKNVAKMHQEYANSIDKTAQQLTLQEKIQAEVNGIMQETQFQIGDAAKYADTYSGRLAYLNATLRDIKVNIGNAFMPIANTVIPILQSLANWLSKVTASFAAFTQALFGKATKVSTKATEQQATAIGDLGDATEKAGKQTKGALAGFDEINTLSMNEGGGTGVGVVGGGISTNDVIQEVDDGTGGVMGNISTKATEMAEKVKTAFNNMKNTIVENKNIIIPALGAIAGALAGVAILSGIASVVDAFKTLQKTTTGLWGLLKAHPMLLVVAAIGALIGALVTAYLTNDEFRAKVDKLWDRIKTDLTPVIQKLGEVLLWVWNSVMVPMGQFIGNVFVKAFEVLGAIGKVVWENIMIPFGSFLKTVFIESMNAAIDIMKYWGDYIKSTFEPIIKALINVFEYLWNNVFKPLSQFMITTFINTFDLVTKAIGTQIEALETTFKGLINFIAGVFTNDWKRAWEGVKNIFKGIFDSLYGSVKLPLNLIIDAINTVITGLNKLQIKIPDWVPGVGGRSWGINIGTIPHLAKGGITNGPTLAMVGDNPGGREVISPLDDLTDIIASAVGSAVMAAMNMNNNSNRDTEVKIYLDSTQMARAIVPAINRESRRVGQSLIIY